MATKIKVEVEFSLALNNRTGKFFICRDMIDDIRESVSGVRYWRVSSAKLPGGLYARILGRLMTWEYIARTQVNGLDAIWPRMKRRDPVVFTDPLQVIFYRVKREDLVIVHDMGPITHPEFYAAGVQATYQKIFTEVAKVGPRLVFVSKKSQLEYERIFGKSYSAAKVVYPGLRLELSEGEQEPLAELLSRPFLLTVGAVGLRKNQLRAIDAFERSGLVEKGFSYVICGGPEPGFESVRSRAESLPWAHVTGYVNEAQLRWLYSQASGFVLPSLLEGFGIPAVEAVVRGLVPLVTRDGALHEVTGDSAILVDAGDVSSIAAGMYQLVSLTAEEKAQRLAELRKHASFFTREQARSAWRDAVLAVN